MVLTGLRRDVIAARLDPTGTFWTIQGRRSYGEDWGDLTIFTLAEELFGDWPKSEDPFKKFPLVEHPPLKDYDDLDKRMRSGEISRGHHSLTPNSAQPACISQNSSGGLWW